MSNDFMIAIAFSYICKCKPWSIGNGQVKNQLFMLIGELVAKTGLTRDTIRFYEKQGLIKLGRKQRRNNNYKEYSDEVLNRLLIIKRVKNFGFTLNEAADLLDMIEIKKATCTNISDLIEKKVKVLDAKISEMILFRNQLIAGVQQCRDCCTPAQTDENCPILVTDNFQLLTE